MRQSLDSEVDPDAEAAWSAEIRARLERVDTGTARTISGAEARRRIHAGLRYDHDTRRYLLRRFPFSVVDRAEPDRILIVAAAHTR
jgi:hypothetical protein